LTYEKGYFDPDVKANSLLNLWSLGVEEQFYFIWPFAIILVIKFFRQRAFLLLSIFTISSFAFSIIMVNRSAKFAFYFPFCRFWQMSVGGLIAYKNFTFKNQFISNALSLIAVCAILISVFNID
jgi:peptidoglycan/LPS O-acetylase OafA/YrhL